MPIPAGLSKRGKVRFIMHEYGAGRLHSGSHTGKVVKDHAQAVAIALSEAGLSRRKRKGKR